MPVTRIDKDPAALTMTVTADFDAPVERVWRLWSDPRQLEQWWGPPGYPATFLEHDLTPGGNAVCAMTGPQGERHHIWWEILALDPPHFLEFHDGFADESGAPLPDTPTMTVSVRLAARSDGGTTMTTTTTFPSSEAMQQLLEMGAEEGFSAALAQIDDVLSASAA